MLAFSHLDLLVFGISCAYPTLVYTQTPRSSFILQSVESLLQISVVIHRFSTNTTNTMSSEINKSVCQFNPKHWVMWEKEMLAFLEAKHLGLIAKGTYTCPIPMIFERPNKDGSTVNAVTFCPAAPTAEETKLMLDWDLGNTKLLIT
ncbi:hypothetical protein BDV98DRAFT_599006 [Pterulicium gracile]|uniref:Uncharacterized protein n=1 Tax=Pterulicium gracile TaxID=1884261 RepID=A0A5C3PZ74_9AGAR|nr:hypothetical protein BDV98DRAFT_599006 [Pterula gracilis]